MNWLVKCYRKQWQLGNCHIKQCCAARIQCELCSALFFKTIFANSERENNLWVIQLFWAVTFSGRIFILEEASVSTVLWFLKGFGSFFSFLPFFPLREGGFPLMGRAVAAMGGFLRELGHSGLMPPVSVAVCAELQVWCLRMGRRHLARNAGFWAFHESGIEPGQESQGQFSTCSWVVLEFWVAGCSSFECQCGNKRFPKS